MSSDIDFYSKNSDNYVELLSAKQVAVWFGVTQNTIWRWAREGKIPKPAKFGGTTKWSRQQLSETIKKQFQNS